MAPRILVIDDEHDVADGLARYLRTQGFEVVVEYRGGTARATLDAGTFHLAIIDLGLPDENGLDLARWVAARFPTLGLIILTGNADPIDRTIGIEIGADDYVTKPFFPRELLARVRTILRRLPAVPDKSAIPPIPDQAPEIAFAGYVLSGAARAVTNIKSGQRVELTTAEFDLLQILASAAGVAVSRHDLSMRLHGRRWDAGDRTIDQLVVQVRRKLEKDSGVTHLIVTVRNVGYMLARTVE